MGSGGLLAAASPLLVSMRRMNMADSGGRLNHVESCQLGKFGSDGVALKINFAMSTTETREGPRQSAEFEMSRQVARGLVEALMKVLDDSMRANAKPVEN